MALHLEPERAIFLVVDFVCLIVQVALYFSALTDGSYLQRISASETMRDIVDVNMLAEYVRAYISVGGFCLGLASLVTTSTPRSIFSVLAVTVVTSWVVLVQITGIRAFRRRRRMLYAAPMTDKLSRTVQQISPAKRDH